MKNDLAARSVDLSPAQIALLERRLQGKPGNSTLSRRIPRRTDRAVAPLSFGQERLWFVDQFNQESAVYNMPAAMRLEGKLDIAALEKSLHEIIRRHEVLRTSFQMINGQLLQIVHEELAPELAVIDLEHMHRDEAEEEISRQAAAGARHLFDLSHGSLVWYRLLKLAKDEHVLLFNVHHIIFDGWSMGVFFQEMDVLYEAFLHGESSPLPELPIQFGDFARWQKETLQDERLDKLLAYWNDRLSGVPTVLDLPTDRPRKAIQSFNGAICTFTWPDSLLEQVEAFSQRKGVTLFITLISVFKTLLHRYTEQEDIVVGTPVAGRTLIEIEPLIGHLLNTLALHVNLSGELSFQELLIQVREAMLGAMAHQELPFERLVEELQLERDLSRHPLFQVMFVLQNAPLTLNLSGLDVRLEELSSGKAKFDLNVQFAETSDGLFSSWEYNTDLFDEDTIVRMAEHFRNLLECVIAQPGMKLAKLPLMTEQEKKLLLEDWAQGPSVEIPETTIHELIEAQAVKTPDHIAVIFEEEKLTYRELNERANQLAWYLRRQGVGANYPVGVFMERSLEMMVALLGIIKSGGAYVPIDPNYPAKRIDDMLEDSGVSIVLTQEHLQLRLPQKISSLHLDGDWQLWLTGETANPELLAAPEDMMYIIYTSGSTGKPKGVMNTHRGVCNRLHWMQSAYELTEEDRVMQKTPFSFDVSVWEFFWPLMSGACLVIARPEGHKDTSYLARLIQEQRITTMHFVPSMLRIFLENPESANCRTLTRVICSGEALPHDIMTTALHRLNANLYNLYGPTEAAIDVSAWICRPEKDEISVPIGKPIANTELYVLDANMEPVPVGIPGELYIGGVQVAKGYWNKPELTAKSFVPHPFRSDPEARLYKTGDLVRYRRDGNLAYLKRKDHQIKLRGFRIELGEVEHALLQHPSISQAVATLHEHIAEDKRLVAYIVMQQESSPTMESLRLYMQACLPDYMVPSVFVCVDQIPLTPNGKVDRNALPKPEFSNQFTYVAPQTPIEKVLAEVWSQVLGIDKVGVHDHFFEIGGHSLLASQITARIGEHLQVELPLMQFFKAPTITGIIAYWSQNALHMQRLEKVCEMYMILSGISEEEAAALLIEQSQLSERGGE
ncbi:amino acid adenylation domain-containing protein [Paenibacillus sp. SI8]|uniref:non-ribosomal peptide synthetase n=1 Tax=unclassified Paenibacillus TaxID=185978 RepID=UPI0034671D24